jgi:hypothetical protein
MQWISSWNSTETDLTDLFLARSWRTNNIIVSFFSNKIKVDPYPVVLALGARETWHARESALQDHQRKGWPQLLEGFVSLHTLMLSSSHIQKLSHSHSFSLIVPTTVLCCVKCRNPPLSLMIGEKKAEGWEQWPHEKGQSFPWPLFIPLESLSSIHHDHNKCKGGGPLWAMQRLGSIVHMAICMECRHLDPSSFRLFHSLTN